MDCLLSNRKNRAKNVLQWHGKEGHIVKECHRNPKYILREGQEEQNNRHIAMKK